jgi:tetratricopeptide (TPR) repeat protein
MILFHSIGVPACLLLFAAVSFGQLTGLEGDVKGVDGKLLPNAVVKIVRIDVSRNYQVKTDKKGHYYYTGLPAGLYTVSVQVDGADVAAITGIMTQPGVPLQVNFELADSPEQQAQKAVLSVRKVRGEWSFIKPVTIQEAPKQVAAAPPAVLPAEPSRAMTAGQKAASEKELSDRAELAKRRNAVNNVYAEGIAALDAKRYEDAITSFDKAREAAPKQALVWANLALAYVGLAGTKTGPDADSALQKGLDAYTMSIELKPDDAVVHNNYARALARAGKFSEMRVEIKKSADLDPASAAQSYYSLGALLTNVGKIDAAVDVFKVAIARGPDDPRNAEAYYQYAVALVSKAQVGADGKIVPAAGTLELLRKYLELAPNGPSAQGAKDMLATLGSSIDTKFNNTTKKKK